ncbi:MAG: hypothetical protein VR73_09865 [Gammaproteobacteria bacterium BRH_c0]|nr:MAG: hypothetical protein VR73_09865 [Gammaproteobacteria bacterium BRH_c0]
MALEEKLLIVVNPAASKQPALDRAVNIAQAGIYEFSPEIHLLVTVDQSSTDARADNDAVYRDGQWLNAVTQQLQSGGIEPHIRISWSKDWADSILYSAGVLGVSSIVVSHPGKSANRAFSDEFWYLVRNAPIPVSVVQSARAPKGRPVIIAMDLQDQKLSELNKRILTAGQLAARIYGSELHCINAYQDSLNYPDRAKLAELTGIPNERIHLKAGEPYTALHELAEKLDPDLFIVGATRRTGFRAALRGRKLGDILMTIEHDLLVIT